MTRHHLAPIPFLKLIFCLLHQGAILLSLVTRTIRVSTCRRLTPTHFRKVIWSLLRHVEILLCLIPRRIEALIHPHGPARSHHMICHPALSQPLAWEASAAQAILPLLFQMFQQCAVAGATQTGAAVLTKPSADAPFDRRRPSIAASLRPRESLEREESLFSLSSRVNQCSPWSL